MSNLYDHQNNFLSKNLDKRLLCWSTGTGKTRTAIEWANRKPFNSILVICPKSLKQNWMREISKYGIVDKHWKVLSKEEFKKVAEELDEHQVVIVDEAHYFAGIKSQMSKDLSNFLRRWKVEHRLLLTATPYMSTPWNIYTLARHLGYEWSWMSFKEKFFYDRYIGRRVVPQVKPDIEEAIAELVGKIGDVIRLDECADVPEQIFETEEFEINAKQKKAIAEVMEINPIVRFTKHHQLENGALKGDEYRENLFIDSDKHDRVRELCSTNDKIIVVCRYNLQIDFLKDYLKEIGKPIHIIRGDVKDRDGVVQAAEADKQAIVLVNAACSEGYELPSFPLMIFASMSFSYKDFKQMTGRILRINRLKKNAYVHLVTKGVDLAVYNAIMKKQDFDIEIYARESDVLPGEKLSNGLQQVVPKHLL